MSPVQPNASVVATGLGIRYISDWAYAYSGIVSATGASMEELLSFTSGSGFIVGKLSFTEGERGADAVYFETYLNDHRVIEVAYDATPANENPAPYPLLIPPFTKVLVQWSTAGSSRNGTAWFVGRVYGAK